MKNNFGIILIIAALALGYLGFDKMQNSNAGIKIGDIEISATDKSGNEKAYIFLGLGVVCLIGGIALVSRGKAISV